MKKLLLLALLYPCVYAQDALHTRVKTLEKQVEGMQRILKDYDDELELRMPIIENNERKTILDKLNFSPELQIRADKFLYKNDKIEGENTKIVAGPYNGMQHRNAFSKNFDIAGYIRFRLNLNAQLDENTKFYGRLLFAQSTQSYQRICILSRDIKSQASSGAFDVDRAYIDYNMNGASDFATTFTFGLLPTTGGTPMQFAQNSKRQSVFPALVFDMNTFGVILTQKFAQESFLRAVLAKAYTLRATFYPYQCNRENIDNATVLGLYGDTKLTENTLLSLGVNYLQDFKAHPYLGPDVTAENAHVLGDLMTLGLGVDSGNIAKSGLTLFAHTACSIPYANDNNDSYRMRNDSATGFSTASYAEGKMISKVGYAYYMGAKYDTQLPLSFGAEYNHGSKYYFSATQGAEDIYNKLATRGDVYELYGTYNFYKHMYAKLGYMHSRENYTGSGWHFGEPAKKYATQQVSYLLLNAKF